MDSGEKNAVEEKTENQNETDVKEETHEEEKHEEVNEKPEENKSEIVKNEKKNEETTNKPQKSNSSLKWVGIGVFLTLLLGVVIWFIFSRRLNRPPMLPIPYVFNGQYRKELLRFIATPSHTRVLVATGPRGIGKLRGMRQIISENNNTFSTPVFFDFESLPVTISADDFKDFLIDSFAASLEAADGNIIINQTVLNAQLPYLSTSQFRCPTKITDRIKDQNLVKIADIACGTLDTINQYSVTNFFELIDQTTPALGTYLFVSDPSNIVNKATDKSANSAISGFVQFLMNYGKGEYQLPTVVAVQNVLAKNMRFISNNPSTFKVIYVEEFNEAEAIQQLTKTEKVFTKREVKELRSYFGGFGEHFAFAHDMMIEKKSVSEAHQILLDSYVKSIIRATHSNGDAHVMKERIAFLKRLKKKGYVSVENFEEASRHFMNHGILKILDNGKVDLISHDVMVAPANKVVARALKVAINSL